EGAVAVAKEHLDAILETLRVRHGEVEVAAVPEIPHRHPPEVSPAEVEDGGLERAVAVAQQDAQPGRADKGSGTHHGEVEDAVVPEIPGPQVGGVIPDREGAAAPEGAVAVAEQHADAAFPEGDNVGNAVAVEVADHGLPGLTPDVIGQRDAEHVDRGAA